MSANRKKLYGCILLLGLAGLLVDRLLFAEPSAAVATTSEPEPVDSEQPDPSAANGPYGPTTGNPGALAAAPFPRELPPLNPNVAVRDIFALTAVARRAMSDPVGLATSGGPLADNVRVHGTTIAQFTEKHRLSAVMAGAGARLAIVDDRWLQIGQSVDGCKLLEITGQKAIFQCADGAAELEVATAGSDSPR
jgi:hypothetical protein